MLVYTWYLLIVHDTVFRVECGAHPLALSLALILLLYISYWHHASLRLVAVGESPVRPIR